MSLAEQAAARSQAAREKQDLEDDKVLHELIGKILAAIEKACDNAQRQTGFAVHSSDAVRTKVAEKLRGHGFRVTINGLVLQITW